MIGTIYDLSTGKKLWEVDTKPQYMNDQVQAGQGLYEGQFDGEVDYIVNGVKTARPDMAATVDKTELLADDIEQFTLTDLPDPCEILITGEGVRFTETVSGGTASYTLDTPGAYLVELSVFPSLNKEFTVNGN